MSDETSVLDNPSQIELFRLSTLLKALELELKGLKMSRGQSAASIIKREFNLKGTTKTLLPQFTKIVADRRQQVLDVL